MPEIRRGQRDRRAGADQSDFGPGGLRGGLSAQGCSARRNQRKFRLCGRCFAAARLRRQPAALADFAAAAAVAVFTAVIVVSAAIAVFKWQPGATALWFSAQWPDFVDRSWRRRARTR